MLAEAAGEALYGDVDLSPDGRRILFVWTDTTNGNVDLWVQDATGGAPPVRFTTHPDVDHLAAFSADGGEIAWEAHAGGAIRVDPGIHRRAAELGAAPPHTHKTAIR